MSIPVLSHAVRQTTPASEICGKYASCVTPEWKIRADVCAGDDDFYDSSLTVDDNGCPYVATDTPSPGSTPSMIDLINWSE